MQSDIPSIAERGAIVVNGQKRSDYATFEDTNDVIKPIMQTHGFAITFKVENTPGGLTVTGILMPGPATVKARPCFCRSTPAAARTLSRRSVHPPATASVTS
ncbi:hypothetical protein [Pseudomonas sp.]|uniref:hypothetical protein n=1 Tax=Pseudomonas sp. TaxID=306 RepID=UPI003917DAC1